MGQLSGIQLRIGIAPKCAIEADVVRNIAAQPTSTPVKRWGECFSLIITTSLVPVEVYEIYRHPNAIKCLVLVLNIAAVVYLAYRIRNERRA